MSAPIEFCRVYEGLQKLTQAIASGGYAEDRTSQEAMRWFREEARGSLTLAQAAVLAMRHEAGTRGVEGDADGARATLRALELVEDQVDPPEKQDSSPKMPKQVRVPEAIKKQAPAVQGWRLGKVEILAEPRPSRWRLSVSHPDRFPYIKELMLARGVTGDVDKTFAAVIPAPSAAPRRRGAYVVDLVETATRTTEEPARK